MITASELSKLIDRHWGPLIAWVGASDEAADDIVQQAFIALARQAKTPDNPNAWLYRTCRNLAINERLKRSRRSSRHQSVAKPESQTDPVWRSAEASELATLLGSLDEVQRYVVVARIWGELSFDEIADATQQSKATTWRQFQSAIDELRQRYGVSVGAKLT